jgi:hypothetical protein
MPAPVAALVSSTSASEISSACLTKSSGESTRSALLRTITGRAPLSEIWIR